MNYKCIHAKLAYPTRAIVGEGSLWDEDHHRLLWVDILDHKIYSFNPRNGANTGFDIGQDIGSVVITEGGLWAYTDPSGICFLNPETGETTNGQKPEKHNPNIRFNDGKCDPRGAFWAGTMTYDGSKGAGVLYEFNMKGEVIPKIKKITMSNGLVWSKDCKKFYFIDSPTYKIQQYQYDKDTGGIKYERIAAIIDKHIGMPDGMTIDDDGYLWIALFGGGKVIRINPETGKTVFEVQLPVPNITSCTFGNESLDELYITTASYSMNNEQLRQFPLSGSLFKARVPFMGLQPYKMKI